MTLPERLAADIEILRKLGNQVEVVEDGSRFHVIVRGVDFPSCYEPRHSDVMMIADYQYPQSALDMFWTLPHVRLHDGTLPRNADQFEQHCGGSWQRWSWHYPGWSPATHSVLSHLEVFFSRLAEGM